MRMKRGGAYEKRCGKGVLNRYVGVKGYCNAVHQASAVNVPIFLPVCVQLNENVLSRLQLRTHSQLSVNMTSVTRAWCARYSLTGIIRLKSAANEYSETVPFSCPMNSCLVSTV